MLHLPQLCYFAVFTFGLLAPFPLAASGLATVASMWNGGRRRELLAGTVCVLGAVVYVYVVVAASRALALLTWHMLECAALRRDRALIGGSR